MLFRSRILIESHSTRSEAAGDELDGPTLAKIFKAQAHAVELLEKDPTPFIHYLVAETGGLLEAKDLQSWRLLHAAPQPYTRERFDDTTPEDILVFDCNTFNIVRSLKTTHSSYIHSLGISPSGQLIAAASQDNTASALDVSSGTVVAVLNGPR